MAEITDEDVAQLLPLLEEAARAQQQTIDRFVPPRVGIVEQAAARRDQFIVGRRGVGKTTLLLTVQQKASAGGTAVAFVDLETIRGIPYPDVLIHLLIELLKSLRTAVSKGSQGKGIGGRWAGWHVVRMTKRLERELTKLLGEPQVVERTVRKMRRSSGKAGAGMGISMPVPHLPVRASASAEGSAERERHETEESRFEQTKMEGLYAAVNQFRTVLGAAVAAVGDEGGMVILDDFYHVSSSDQPYVLGYLHQVVKNLNIWLKIGAVKHRLNSFLEGDPPTGLQVGHDASEVSLDVTLEAFETAQTFLESVLQGVIDPTGLAVAELATDGGRTRLVLASGGVARDYINLVVQALRSANDRVGTTSRPHNRITAEDANEVSQHLAEQKQQDLLLDAGPSANYLRDRSPTSSPSASIATAPMCSWSRPTNSARRSGGAKSRLSPIFGSFTRSATCLFRAVTTVVGSSRRSRSTWLIHRDQV